MTAIWQGDGANWRLLAPSGFPDEATLHSMVEQGPQMLPLAGIPGLIVVGREVLLGNGYADLLAVEPSGRLAVIEVKLARNAEARRAVVAQVLTYAAYLKGLDAATLEQQILGKHLRSRGWSSLAEAVAANDQEGSFDAADFAAGFADSLAQGRFRLVLVLDEAPEELVRLVGYLQSVSDRWLLDLITVAAYNINGSQVIVPQRVEPEQSRTPTDTSPLPSRSQTKGRLVAGGEDFAATIPQVAPDKRPMLQALYEWAVGIEREGLAKLYTFHGKSNRWTLVPRLEPDNAGLVTVWNENGGYLQFWRSVFERRAPKTLERVEAIVSPIAVGQGNATRDITPELLTAVTEAYREAALGKIVPSMNDSQTSDETI